MPIVVVYGLPKSMDEPKIGILWKDIRLAIAKIPELGLKEKDVIVFFPSDRLSVGLGEEIIIFVKGLFITPQRDDIVRHKIAEEVTKTVRLHLPKSYVECLVEPFDTHQGYHAW